MILLFCKIYDVVRNQFFGVMLFCNIHFMTTEFAFLLFSAQFPTRSLGALSEPRVSTERCFVSGANNGVIEVETFCLTLEDVKR